MSSTAPTGRAPEPDGALKAALHYVFDSQIPNYGDYNLVCVTECGGSVSGPRPGAPVPTGLVVGYRRRPVELVLAPFDRGTLSGTAQPTTIDLTNLAYVSEPFPGAFDVATSTGRVVTFTLRPVCELGTDSAVALAQEDDAADLETFLRDLVGL
ncbi:hypothetical protein [Sinomonas soli]